VEDNIGPMSRYVIYQFWQEAKSGLVYDGSL
jgi:hypothetical protein